MGLTVDALYWYVLTRAFLRAALFAARFPGFRRCFQYPQLPWVLLAPSVFRMVILLKRKGPCPRLLLGLCTPSKGVEPASI